MRTKYPAPLEAGQSQQPPAPLEAGKANNLPPRQRRGKANTVPSEAEHTHMNAGPRRSLARQPASIWRLLWLWGPVVIYMVAIHMSSSVTDPLEPTGVSDKTLHMLAFGGLALVSLRALAGGMWAGVTRWTLIGCVAIAVLYGAKDEWQQKYTPGRTSDAMDLVADLGGAVIAASAAGAWGIIRRL